MWRTTDRQRSAEPRTAPSLRRTLEACRISLPSVSKQPPIKSGGLQPMTGPQTSLQSREADSSHMPALRIGGVLVVWAVIDAAHTMRIPWLPAWGRQGTGIREDPG